MRVIELGGIGPGPHAAIVLADLGADVVRVRRPGGLTMPAEDRDLLHRGKQIVDLGVTAQPRALLDLACWAVFGPARASDSASARKTARRSTRG